MSNRALSISAAFLCLAAPLYAGDLVLAGHEALAAKKAPAQKTGGSQVSGSRPATVPSLAKAYERYFPIGAAVTTGVLGSQGDLLAAQVNSLVAECEMKWFLIHPIPGDDDDSYSFAKADTIIAFAAAHGMKVRGHALVWHQQMPNWPFALDSGAIGAAAKAEVLDIMKGHISRLLAHFQGKVYCWDVVNEALSERGEGWRVDSPWHMLAGDDDDGDGIPDYILKAFAYARAAEPRVKLFYNDFGIESGPKLEKAFDLVKALKARGLIDGVGIQGHWSIYDPDPQTVRAAIRRFASLGVDVQITELDLSMYRGGDPSSLREPSPALLAQQAERYGALFKVFREESGPGRFTGVTFWGIADDHTWLDNFPVSGRKDWPLLFDTGHQPKKAFESVVKW